MSEANGNVMMRIIPMKKPELLLGYFIYHRSVCSKCEDGKVKYFLEMYKRTPFDEIPDDCKQIVDCQSCDGSGYIVREVPLMEFAREIGMT